MPETRCPDCLASLPDVEEFKTLKAKCRHWLIRSVREGRPVMIDSRSARNQLQDPKKHPKTILEFKRLHS